MASLSPTQLSLREAEKRGWTAAVVEKWNPYARIRQDMFGFVDIVALAEGEVIFIQATSDSNVSARAKKIADAQHLPAVRRANVRVLVWGWKKRSNKFVLREVDCS